MRIITKEIAIIGGGLGGVAAALSLCQSGHEVVMTEETDWIGGQVTSQGVPPDEYPWIEKVSPTHNYKKFRDNVRQYYKSHYPLTRKAFNEPNINPGNAWVSHLSHEPKVALRVLQDMLAPYVNSGQLTILYHVSPIAVEKNGQELSSVTVRKNNGQDEIKIRAHYFLDATETGELLPLAQIPYAVGAEARSDTGEEHAAQEASSKDTQAFTYVAAIDYVEGRQETIEKPARYEFWKSLVPEAHYHSLLNWAVGNQHDPTPMKTFTLFPNDQGVTDLFTYRRVLDTDLLSEPIYKGDISLLNWPQNDYFLGSIIDEEQEVVEKHLYDAKQLTLSLVYWLQTEAPRLDGGYGYPGIRLRKDVFDTEDGLSKYPYIRESRRIKAIHTIKEEDVAKKANLQNGIKVYEDSVGIGSYHLDLHTTAESKKALYVPSFPYEIPLGSFIQTTVSNVLPACKNIGTTHITNGCYRLHPTEWAIGEAAGHLVSEMFNQQMAALDFYQDKALVRSFLKRLDACGIRRHWPEEISKAVLEDAQREEV